MEKQNEQPVKLDLTEDISKKALAAHSITTEMVVEHAKAIQEVKNCYNLMGIKDKEIRELKEKLAKLEFRETRASLNGKQEEVVVDG